MHLSYNNIDLKIERTSGVSMTGVYDQSGTDRLYDRVEVSLLCVWSPFSTGSQAALVGGGFRSGDFEPQAVTDSPRVNPAVPLPPPVPGGPPAPLPTGVRALPVDTLGTSLRRLRQALLEPRQQLRIDIGPDRVWEVPGVASVKDPVTGIARNVRLMCDPENGPIPIECRIISIHGDKTAIVAYRIRFCITDCVNYVLSNRWSVVSMTDEQHLTTRITSGIAVLRPDLLIARGTTADAFRANFTLAVPAGFIRKRVLVTATEDGRELHYRVEDRQAYLNLSYQSKAVKIHGTATAGAEFPYKDLGGMVSSAKKSFRGILSGLFPGPLEQTIGQKIGLFGPEDSPAAAVAERIPTRRANCEVKVYGKQDASLGDLIKIAADVAIDRFTIAGQVVPILPWFNIIIPLNFFIASVYVTQIFNTDGPGPAVYLRMEVIPANPGPILASMFNIATAPSRFMNLTKNIFDTGNAPLAVDAAIDSTNPPFPGGDAVNVAGGFPRTNASRGTWISFLVTQALTTDCSRVPAIPLTENQNPTLDTLPVDPATATPVNNPVLRTPPTPLGTPGTSQTAYVINLYNAELRLG
jgi:hypothetical protein